MKILVDRFKNNGNTTIDRIYIDGNFECFGLEDEPRKKKVRGETRIPAGTYEIKLRKEGGFHERYSKRFPDFHVGMLHVTNVPGFEYILIHIGNTDEDTAGCLLVGEYPGEGWALINSTKTYENLYRQVAGALLAGEQVFIKYEDNDL